MLKLRRSAVSCVVSLCVFGLAVLGVGAPAAAHVDVSPQQASPGEFLRLAFEVPNESDTESTAKVEIHLPEDAPVASVSTLPVPGWTVAVTMRKLDAPVEVHGSPITKVVSVITWTAEPGAAIEPGRFQEFPVRLGPLPQVDQVVFKALQTYSDGTVVRWIEEPDGSELEFPAPVLRLAVPAETDSGPAETDSGPAATAGAGQDGGGSAGWMSVAALIFSVLALMAAAASWVGAGGRRTADGRLKGGRAEEAEPVAPQER